MRTSKRPVTRVVVIALFVLSVAACATHHGRPPLIDQLLRASTAAGVSVRSEEVFALTSGSESFATAPIAGWEQIPATALREGVNFAFATFDQSQNGIPAGSYTLRATSEDIRLGTVPTTVQLIDGYGKVANEIRAEAEIHSLTVPPDAASRRTFVTAAAAAQLPNVGPGLTYVWYRCPNGVCIRMPVLRARDFTSISANTPPAHDHRAKP